MEKKYQVFISSTFEDLKEERAAVITALLKAGFIPTCMEYFTASCKTQWEVIEKIIPQCDYYIVIVAGKYGSIEPQSGISYTEKEYDYALHCNVPTYGFLYSKPEDLRVIKTEKSPKKRKQLEKFCEKIKSNLCDFWDNKDNLATVVLAALNNQVKDSPRVGWVRADKVVLNQDLIDNDLSFLDTVVDLHIEHTSNPFEEDAVVEKMTISIQWITIVEKVCGLMNVPLTYQGAVEEIASLWDGIVDSDVSLIINTLVNKGILEVGSESIEGLGVQNYCTVTTYGHKVLADYLTRTNSELAIRDRKTLVSIMDCFSTRLMDNYFIDGPEFIEHDLLTSFDMCNALVTASSFTLYGETISSLWQSFFSCWKEAVMHDEWYVPVENSRYRFMGLKHDEFVTTKDERNFNHLLDNHAKLQRTYHDFISYVKDTCKLNVVESSNKFERDLHP